MATNYQQWYDGTSKQFLNTPETEGEYYQRIAAAGQSPNDVGYYQRPEGSGFAAGADNPQPGEYGPSTPKYLYSSLDDPALRAKMANELGRQVQPKNNFSLEKDLPGVTPDQFLNYYQQQGEFQTVEREDQRDWLDKVMEPLIIAGIGTAFGGAGAAAFGGAGGGAAAGAGTGAVDAASVAAADYAGISGANALSAAPWEAGSGWWNNTFAANDTGTMSDVTAWDGSTGGDMDLWNADALDASLMPDAAPDWGGLDAGPGAPYTGGESLPGGITGTGGVSPGMFQKAKDLASQLGITPVMALKSLMGAVGRGAPAALGMIGANQQANSLSALADKYMGFGAPSRARYEASYAPGFSMQNDPGFQDAINAASKANLHGLSTQGNPSLSPNAQSQNLADLYGKVSYPALQRFREQNANTGGIGTLTAAAPGAESGAIGARSNVFNAAGAGVADIFNTKPSLAEILKQLKEAGAYA